MPQAIICSNDYMALALSNELIERGIRIPEDICVSGFDDLKDAQFMNPPLSSVSVQFEEMVVACLERVIGLANHETFEDKDIRISAIPKFRGSCGCNDTVSFKNEVIYEEYYRYRYIAQTCIYMATDFECILSEQNCVDLTGRIALELGAKNIFICLCEKRETDEDGNEIIRKNSFSDTVHLRLYYDENGEAVKTDIPFSYSDLLPEELQSKLENKVNYILTVHSRSEVFGYIILQLDDKNDSLLEERYDFLCINFGIGLSRLYMYEEKESMNSIKQMYIRDPLTGMYNRRGFDNEIAQMHRGREKNRFNVAVASVDMDGLKYINDNFGHSKGDDAIIAVAACINDALNEGEFCARMGGDEFEALLILDSDDRIAEFRNSVKESLKKVNDKIDDDYVVDTSMGICLVDNWESFNDFTKEADRLMYEEKRNKKNKQGKR